MQFNNWIETFVEEKGIDPETVLEVQGDSGTNYIPIASLISMIKAAPKEEQEGIKEKLIEIDINNADVLDYFRHLCKAIAV